MSLSMNMSAFAKAWSDDITISNCITSSKMEDGTYKMLKSIKYGETRVADIYGKLDDGLINDYVYGRTSNSIYSHYSSVTTSVSSKTGPDRSAGVSSTTAGTSTTTGLSTTAEVSSARAGVSSTTTGLSTGTEVISSFLV